MKERQSRTALGRAGEEAAARHLSELGYRILARNVRFRFGELDIVAEQNDCLVFVEVKTRTGAGYGSAAEAVTPAKQRQLVRLAGAYLAATGGRERPCRFDVVTVEPGPAGAWICQVIANAFGEN
ncbi:MAG TPA: YraN family protein [Symbiobacteriaceae bacterium]|nr:YraN family protein [Symbiobacteriaceae bacterium]